jgi:hypothetical protein
VAAVFAVVCALLIVVPLNPVMPGLQLDSSWAAAANAAVERGLVFGDDFVFTSGPYASIYTRMYLPATDRLMLLGSLCLTITVMLAFLACVPAPRRPWLAALPILMTLPGMGDALLLCVPWMLVLLVARGPLHRRSPWLSLVYATVAVCALLPLIKGSTTVAAVACVGIAACMLARTQRWQLVFLPVAFIVALAVEWCAAGQPLGALPAYFTAQGAIIAGYGDAMSLPGPWQEPVYIAAACALLILATLRAPLQMRTAVSLATSITLFIGFKAGMVRHDAHAAIAAATSVIVATYATFTATMWRWRAVTVFAGLVGLVVMGTNGDMSPAGIAARTSHALGNSIDMGADRLQGAPILSRRFRESVADINATVPIPADGRTADLYTSDISAVIFSGERWSPRPIIQSYSAYTPSLVQRNVDHLRQGGPDRIYWKVYTIDGHYPSLDDGASWRWLLGGYQLSGRVADYLVLQNTGRPNALPLGPIVVEGRPALGDIVPLPDDSPLWVAMTFRPTLMGKLRELVYKPLPVLMTVRYADGDSAVYRIIPGMTETGFLLSPTVESTGQLESLLTRGFVSTPAARVPVAIVVDVPSGAAWMEQNYHIVVHRLSVPVVPAGKRALDAAAATTESFAPGGECTFDTLDGDAFHGDSISPRSSILALTGLAAFELEARKSSDETSLLLVDSTGMKRIVHSQPMPRMDVARAYGAEMRNIGFSAVFSLEGLIRPVQVSVLVRNAGTRYECRDRMLIVK